MIRHYLTIKEAAEMIGVSSPTLRNWDRSGKLVAKRLPKNGYRIYRRSDIEKFLKESGIKRRNKKFKLIDE